MFLRTPLNAHLTGYRSGSSVPEGITVWPDRHSSSLYSIAQFLQCRTNSALASLAVPRRRTGSPHI